jgi:beta-lactamase regulating signal transducer with metallopeptidase domain/protocatechuate 3,4-dioxygenase beta subunit
MNAMIEAVAVSWLRASWQAGLLVAVVLAAQWLLRPLLTPRWRHALWFLVVARLLLPVMPPSSVSVYNLMREPVSGAALPTRPATATPTPAAEPLSQEMASRMVDEVRVAGVNHVPVVTDAKAKPVVKSPAIVATPRRWTWTFGMLAWIAGSMGLLLAAGWQAWSLFRKVNRLEAIGDGVASDLLKECKQELGVKGAVRLFEFAGVDSPAVYGFWRARILLPTGLVKRFSRQELRFVFLHELAHIKRRDIAINWLLTFLQILHWFNPLIWIGFARMRADRELACDALALECAGEPQSRPYGATIIRLLEEFARPVSAAPNLLGILEDKNQMRRRLTMIAQFRGSSRSSFVAAIALGALAVVTLTDAQTTATPKEKEKKSPFTPLELRPKLPGPTNGPVKLDTRYITDAENADWTSAKSALSALPRGKTNLAEIPFQCDGVIQLLGAGLKKEKWPFRERVKLPLPTNQFAAIHVLGGITHPDTNGTTAAEVVLTYETGKPVRLPIQVNVHMKDWFRMSHEDPPLVSDPSGRVVWRGVHAQSQAQNKTLRLYCVTLENPRPTSKVTGIELVSPMNWPAVFVTGITLDARKKSERPPPEPDLDAEDSGLKRTLTVVVLDDATGLPIPGARVASKGIELNKTESGTNKSTVVKSIYEKAALADNAGVARLAYSELPMEKLTVDTTAENYAPWLTIWEPAKGPAIPETITVRLQPGVLLGGTVEDEGGTPVAGATVRMSRVYRGGEGIDRSNSRLNFTVVNMTTDGAGKFSSQAAPESILDSLILRVAHEGYADFSDSPRGGSKALQDQTYKIVLKRGAEVTGRVTDTNGTALAGAKVTFQRRNFVNFKEGTTDANGNYQIHNAVTAANETETPMTAVAEGYAPVTKSIKLEGASARMDFALSPGLTIRGQVVDEAGKPISGVSVSRRASPVMQDDSIDWSGKTDDAGNFEWTSAPAGVHQLSFFDRDHQRTETNLSPSEVTQIVTMRGMRKGHGRVVDAQTQLPLTNYFVLPGGTFKSLGPDGKAAVRLSGYAPSDERPMNDPDGRFEVTFTDARYDGVRIRANGFLTQVVQLISRAGDEGEAVIALERSKNFSGLVVDGDGRPVAKISVALGKPQGAVQIDRDGISRIGDSVDRTLTDVAGRFTLEPTAEVSVVVAANADLFGRTSADDFERTHTVVVQPHGRIEGVLRVGQNIGGGRSLSLQAGGNGERVVMFQIPEFRATTDAEGKFVFDRVPAGMVTIAQQIPMGPRSWRTARSTSIEVQPNQVAQVVIGGDGVEVRGKLRMPAGKEVSFAEVSAMMASLRQIVAATTERAVPGMNVRYYSFEIGADGSFAIPDVVNGSYSLEIDLREKTANSPAFSIGKPMASVVKDVEIPAQFNPGSVLDLGELVMSEGAIRRVR